MNVTVKISETIAKEYQVRELRLPEGFPSRSGVHQVDLVTADSMMWDALKQAKEETKPSLAMAYNSLAGQIKKQMDNAQAKGDVSQRNKEEKHFVTLARSEILTLDQVRTSFDDASMAELAADIRVHGLINPITVRPGHDGKFYLVAGERRMNACEIAGVPIVAQVIAADEIIAKRIQLAENIHRDELSLEDKARAVRELYDQLGTMQAVADQVKKSKAWVSKLFALTEPDLGYRAQLLLTNGIVEDLEILGIMARIENTCTYADAEEAYKRAKEGNFTRDQAREFLRQRSEKRKQDTEKAAAKRKEQEEKWQARQAEIKAERERRMVEEAKRPPRRELPDAVRNLLRFYVTTQAREHQGEAYQIVTEFSEIPFSGDGVGDSYQAFDKDEILKAWRELVEAFADWDGEIMTEEYFQENN